MRWLGNVHEWELFGISAELVHHAPTNGYTPTSLHLQFHISRMWVFYFLKALLPLYLTFALSLAVFWYEPKEIADRVEIVLACFLAVVSLLFVISTFLPRTSTLTIIDLVTLLTIGAVGLECCFSVVVSERSHGWWFLPDARRNEGKYDPVAMVHLDTTHFRVLVGMYTGINAALLLPALYRRWGAYGSSFGKYEAPPETAADKHGSDKSDRRLLFLMAPDRAAVKRWRSWWSEQDACDHR